MKRASNSSFAVAFIGRFHAGVGGSVRKKAAPIVRAAAGGVREAAPRLTPMLVRLHGEPETEIGAAVSTR